MSQQPRLAYQPDAQRGFRRSIRRYLSSLSCASGLVCRRLHAESDLEQVSRGDIRPLQRTPVATHPYEHPHFWAAFVLVGDPD